MKFNKNLVMVSLCNIIICIIFFIAYLYCCKDMIIQLDSFRDAFEPFFSYADHGNYVIQAIIRLITFTIPYHLGIHPMDFAGTFGVFFKVTVLVSLGCLLASVALKEIKLRYLQPIVLLLFQFCIIAILFKTGFWQVECANGFGRFIISQFFLILFWTYFIKFYNNNTLPSKKQTVFLCIFALIAGNIHELIAFSSAFSLFFLLVLDLIKNKKANRYLVLSLAFVALGGLLMYFNPNYVFAAKSHSGDVTFQSIMLGLQDWKNFFNIYFYEVIKNHLHFHLLILLITFVGLAKGARRELVIPFLLYVSFFTFFFSFIIAKGDITNFPFLAEDINYPNYWLTHHDFPVIMRLHLLFVFALLLNSCISLIQNNIKQIICISLLLLIAIYLQVCQIKFFFDLVFHSGILSDLKERKQECYEIDSMTLHYINNKAQIILYTPRYSDSISSDYPNYIEKIYGIELDIEDIIWIDKEIAREKFFASGGSYSEYELKNIKFAYLFEKYNYKFDNKRPVKLYYWMQSIDENPVFNINLRIKNKLLDIMTKEENQTE